MSLILLGILNSQVTAGGGGAFDLLETTVLANSSTQTVTFTGLGSYTDYKHLQIRAVTRTNRTTNLSAPLMYFNGDTSTKSYHLLRGTGSSVVSEGYSDQGSMNIPLASSDFMTANNYSAGIIDILDFSNTSKNSVWRAIGGNPASEYWDIRLQSGMWIETSAITSISFQPGFGATAWKASTRFSLYGVK